MYSKLMDRKFFKILSMNYFRKAIECISSEPLNYFLYFNGITVEVGFHQVTEYTTYSTFHDCIRSFVH